MIDNNEGDFGKYIIQKLDVPEGLMPPEMKQIYERFASRVLWIDSKVVEGAFQMNTAWYFDVPAKDPIFPEHVHDYDEMIGFFSGSPSDPYDLGAEIEVGIGGEMHRITRTSMIFVPAGLKHMPLSIKKVERPLFHFSVVMNAEYSGGGAYR